VEDQKEAKEAEPQYNAEVVDRLYQETKLKDQPEEFL
jgi:hypothetical protein